MDGEDRKDSACFTFQQKYKRLWASLIIFASLLILLNMFNSYAENALHQYLFVCEKAYGEFVGWSWVL